MCRRRWSSNNNNLIITYIRYTDKEYISNTFFADFWLINKEHDYNLLPVFLKLIRSSYKGYKTDIKVKICVFSSYVKVSFKCNNNVEKNRKQDLLLL